MASMSYMIYMCIIVKGVSQGVPPHSHSSTSTCLFELDSQFCAPAARELSGETCKAVLLDGQRDWKMEDAAEPVASDGHTEQSLAPRKGPALFALECGSGDVMDDVNFMQRGKAKRGRSPSPRRRRRHQAARDRESRDKETRKRAKNRERWMKKAPWKKTACTSSWAPRPTRWNVAAEDDVVEVPVEDEGVTESARL